MTLLVGTGTDGLEARVGGDLGVNAQGCVTIRDVLIVAPAGSSITDDGTIDMHGYGLFSIGDDFDGGGGTIPVDDPQASWLNGCLAAGDHDAEYIVVAPMDG